jgi:hypothetical protein
MMSDTTEPDSWHPAPEVAVVFLTTGLIRSRARCALERVSSSGELDTMLAVVLV